MAEGDIVGATMSLDEQAEFVVRLLGDAVAEGHEERARRVLRSWADDLVALSERAFVHAAARGMREEAAAIRSGGQAARARAKRALQASQVAAALEQPPVVDFQAHRLGRLIEAPSGEGRAAAR